MFTTGAVVAAVVTYGAFGAVGSMLGRPSLLLLLAVAALAWASVWYLRGRYRLPGGREAVQANRNLAVRGPAGMLYFGALLGVGLLTEMSTPLVYAGAALSLSQGLGWGALYGFDWSCPPVPSRSQRPPRRGGWARSWPRRAAASPRCGARGASTRGPADR